MNMDRMEVERAFKMWRQVYNEHWLVRYGCPAPASGMAAVFKGFTGIDVYSWFTPPVDSEIAFKIRAMAGEHGYTCCKIILANME
jgi:hypothetical protein